MHFRLSLVLALFVGLNLIGPASPQVAEIWVAAHDVGSTESFFTREKKVVSASEIKIGDRLVARHAVHARPGPAQWDSEIKIDGGASLTVLELRLVKAGSGLQTWIRVSAAGSMTAPFAAVHSMWSGKVEISEDGNQVIRVPFSGAVISAPTVGTTIRGIEPLPSIEAKDIPSGSVNPEVARNSLATIASFNQSDYIAYWHKRLTDISSALLRMGLDLPDVDSGNNPADYERQEPRQTQLRSAWLAIVNSFPKEVAPAIAPFDPTFSDLGAAPAIAPLTGAKAAILRDLNLYLATSKKSATLATLLAKASELKVWKDVSERAIAEDLQKAAIGTLRDDVVPSRKLALKSWYPRALNPNSQRLLSGDGGRMLIEIAAYDPAPILIAHDYWRKALTYGLFDHRDLAFLRRLPGGFATPEDAARALVRELENAWKVKLVQNAWQVFAAAAQTRAMKEPDGSRAAVIRDFVQSNFPPTPNISVAERETLLASVRDIAQKAAGEPGIDSKTVGWAILHSIKQNVVKPFSLNFTGALLAIREDDRNLSWAPAGANPDLRGTLIELVMFPGSLSANVSAQPLLSSYFLRWFRQAASLRSSFDFATASGRVSDLRRATEQLNSAEAELAVDDLEDGRRLQQDWLDAERNAREGATDYQFGNVTLQDDILVEEAFVSAGDFVVRGDELALVRPLYSHRLVLALPASMRFSVATVYKVGFDCGNSLVASPHQRRALLALPQPQRAKVIASLARIQNELRKTLEFEAIVLIPSERTNARWVLKAHLKKDRRKITAPVDKQLATAAAATGFVVVDGADGAKRIQFDFGFLEPGQDCSASFDVMDPAVRALQAESQRWRDAQ